MLNFGIVKTTKRIIRSVIVVSFMLLFCACAKENDDEKWQQDISDSDSFMSLTEYYPDIFPRIREGHHWNKGIAAGSKGIYSYDTYQVKNSETGETDSYNFISFLDGETKQVETTEYQMDGLYIDSFEVIYDRRFGIYQDYDEDVILSGFGLVEFMENGDYKVLPDMYEILVKEDLIPPAHYKAAISLYYEPACDCYFIISEDKKKLIKADNTGKEMFCVEGISELGYGDETQVKGSFSFFTSLDDGRLVFIYICEENEYIFTVEGTKANVLSEKECGSEAYGTHVMRDCNNQFLFLNEQATVVSWDISTGKIERLFVDIPDDYYSQISSLMRNKNGELLVVKGGNLMVLSQSGPAESVEITVKPLGYLWPNMEALMKTYTQMHPGVKFNILEETEFADRGNTMGKLMADVSRGGGPDMVIIDQSELYSLEDNDILIDLSDYLPEQTKEKLFDAVLDYGTVDGKLLMLPISGYVEALVVQKKFFSGDTWTLKELLDTIEKGKENGEPFEYIAVQQYTDNPFYILAWGPAMLEKEFVDYENGVSSFDSDTFVRFLNVCKEYTDKHADKRTNPNVAENLSEKQCLKLFLEGDSLLYSPYLMSIVVFSELKKTMGDEFNCVGYPTASGSGNFLSFSYGFAIAKNCKHTDVISDFLNWIYYYDSDDSYKVPLRKDTYEGKIELPDDWNLREGPAIRTSERSIISLEGKEDGSTYIDEYFELLESCSPASDHKNAISVIVYEETEPFFAGEKTAEETAEIIHKRVSLYLMENQ